MRGHREVPQNSAVAATLLRLLPYKYLPLVSPLECALTGLRGTVHPKELARSPKSFRMRSYAKTGGEGPRSIAHSSPRFTPKGTFLGLLGILGAALLFGTPTYSTMSQDVPPPTAADLAAITERGRALYEYDQAAWHATDAVQMAIPKAVEGQRYIAKKENGKWTVVFGKLNEDRSRFGIIYEAEEQATLREFAVQKEPKERQDEGFFLFAARAIEVAMRDFGGASRPYNIAVLLGPSERLYVYLYPAQTKARVYPLGGDARYLLSADGTKILEKRQMHKTIIENQPSKQAKKVVAGYHTHVLSELPEDTDVFHVLTQDPPVPEMVVTPRFIYKVMTDGTIYIEKEGKRKK